MVTDIDEIGRLKTFFFGGGGVRRGEEGSEYSKMNVQVVEYIICGCALFQVTFSFNNQIGICLMYFVIIGGNNLCAINTFVILLPLFNIFLNTCAYKQISFMRNVRAYMYFDY